MGKLNNDEGFRHISYHATDVRKTWTRERKRLAEEKTRRDAEAVAAKLVEEAIEREAVSKVRRIVTK